MSTEAAATAILANSLRLCKDAWLLFNNQRYVSATALAILATEEFTKFMSLTGFHMLPRKDWRDHVQKQTGAAGFIMRVKYQHFLREVLIERRLPDGQAIYSRLRRPAGDLILEGEEEAVFKAVLDRSHDAIMTFMQANMGKHDVLKQNSLYVDVRDDLSVKHTPDEITEATAKERLDFLKLMFDVVGPALAGGPKDVPTLPPYTDPQPA